MNKTHDMVLGKVRREEKLTCFYLGEYQMTVRQEFALE